MNTTNLINRTITATVAASITTELHHLLGFLPAGMLRGMFGFFESLGLNQVAGWVPLLRLLRLPGWGIAIFSFRGWGLNQEGVLRATRVQAGGEVVAHAHVKVPAATTPPLPCHPLHAPDREDRPGSSPTSPPPPAPTNPVRGEATHSSPAAGPRVRGLANAAAHQR